MVEEVVDRHDFQIVGGFGDPEHGAADAAKPVDCHSHQDVLPACWSSAA